MNKATFQKLIDENIEWLEKMPKSLERDLIIHIVKDSPEKYYPENKIKHTTVAIFVGTRNNDQIILEIIQYENGSYHYIPNSLSGKYDYDIKCIGSIDFDPNGKDPGRFVKQNVPASNWRRIK